MADSTTTATSTTPTPKTYIVEHLDPELGPWSELEYLCVARETQAATRGDSRFVLSSLPPALRVPPAIGAVPAFAAERRGVEDMYPGEEARARVCLLDPQAERDLAPEDVGVFDVFLFGGILGEFELAWDFFAPFFFFFFFFSFFFRVSGGWRVGR